MRLQKRLFMFKALRANANSLRLKIVLSLIGMSIFSIALGGLFSRVVLIEEFEDVVVTRSANGFQRDILSYYNLYGSFEEANAAESWNEYRSRFRELRPARDEPPNPDIARFIGTDLKGYVWAPAGSYELGDIVPASELDDAIPLVNVEAVTDDEVIGYILVEGRLTLSGTEAQYLRALTNSWWVSLLIVALVAAPIGILLGRHLTDPINKLKDAIEAMRPKSVYQKVPITSKDEIGLLSQSFNEMSQELATFIEVIQHQKEKIVDTETMRKQALVSISHELRTPLYSLVAQAYGMLDGVLEIDKKEVASLAESLDHLSELVDDLHHLSLADVHRLECDIKPTDFVQVVREAAEAKEDDLASKQFKLNLSLPDELMVEGDSTRLRQILDNLLINCIRYADEGGEISIQLSVTDEVAELVVLDSGPGVPPKSLHSLFDRFYRVEQSRSRATGGTGIGLSLVKTYAELHSGGAEAFLSDEGGLGIRVSIPLTTETTQS
jgi:two-component system, OmpR family, sensor histidine kinase BaeS